MKSVTTAVSYIHVFLRIVQRDLLVLAHRVKNRTINIIWWTLICVYIFEYVGLAVAVGYGLFIASSECAIKGYMRVLPCAGRVIADFHGSQSLFYYLTLPAPSWVVFAALVASTAIEVMAIDFWVLPTAKLLLWNTFHLSFIGCIKVACVFVCSHLFYGACMLLFASVSTKSPEDLLGMRARYIDPIFFTGGYLFTWHHLYLKSHTAAYLVLLNPLIYAAEGMRSAIFGNPDSLPVGLCCAVLLVCAVGATIVGSKRMKKKLDCI